MNSLVATIASLVNLKGVRVAATRLLREKKIDEQVLQDALEMYSELHGDSAIFHALFFGTSVSSSQRTLRFIVNYRFKYIRIAKAIFEHDFWTAQSRCEILSAAAHEQDAGMMASLLASTPRSALSASWPAYVLLCTAVNLPSMQIIEMLLAAGCNPNYYLPIQYCASSDAALLLIQYGADIDHRHEDCHNFTALMLAVYYKCDVKDVLRLLALGADPNGTVGGDGSGQTVTDMCSPVFPHRVDLFALLVASGGRPRANVAAWVADQPAEWQNDFSGRVSAHAKQLARQRIDLIRWRAFDICVALQMLRLPALVTCAILDEACAPGANCVAFHHKWHIATRIKHFKG